MASFEDTSADDACRGGPAEASPRRPGVVLAVACAAQFICVLDASIVNVALPPMQESLGLSADRPAVGGQQLHAHLRRLPAARRTRR